jgi:hypothetical protein
VNENDDGTPSIVDVLTGLREHEPLVKITPPQRMYYNYRLDRPSFAAELASIAAPRAPRDFRSKRQRDEDSGR